MVRFKFTIAASFEFLSKILNFYRKSLTFDQKSSYEIAINETLNYVARVVEHFTLC